LPDSKASMTLSGTSTPVALPEEMTLARNFMFACPWQSRLYLAQDCGGKALQSRERAIVGYLQAVIDNMQTRRHRTNFPTGSNNSTRTRLQSLKGNEAEENI
jgi:hypothetical protein